MKKRKKKGLSAVISTLLLILLALVAVGIIWVVINNIISKGSEEVGFSQFTLDLKIKQVKVEQDGIHITVKRNAGKGDLQGLKFFLSDGQTQKSFEVESNIKELEEKTFVLDYAGILTDISMATKIGGSGQLGNIIDEFNVPGRETIKTLSGLVSWWRFEGNANDEMGINNGVVTGASLVNGRYGKAYEFNADGGRIEVPDSQVLNDIGNSNMSTLVWIYPHSCNGGIWNKMDPIFFQGYGLYYEEYTPNLFRIGHRISGTDIITQKDNEPNKWTHIATTHIYDVYGNGINNMEKIYIDGILNRTRITMMFPSDSPGYNLTIGFDVAIGLPMDGVIDELMIFNKTLSDDEIKYIYNLDLN